VAEVTNPLHTFLTNLLARVHKVQDELSKKMDKPTGNMASGKVWTSPTAKDWGGRLTDQCTAYNSGVGGLSEELAAMLSRTPKTCSEGEAKQWRIELGM
jgi:leucyl aminopeptidase (aminopeptidase T)